MSEPTMLDQLTEAWVNARIAGRLPDRIAFSPGGWTRLRAEADGVRVADIDFRDPPTVIGLPFEVCDHLADDFTFVFDRG